MTIKNRIASHNRLKYQAESLEDLGAELYDLAELLMKTNEVHTRWLNPHPVSAILSIDEAIENLDKKIEQATEEMTRFIILAVGRGEA